MQIDPGNTLIQLAPRNPSRYTSRARAVLSTGEDGFISGKESQGLWCFETRVLSLYRWFINGKPPVESGNSAVEQHQWIGYYIAAAANCKRTDTHECDPAQQTIELKLTREIGQGFCEDVQVTNYTRISTSVKLELEVDADFADPSEAKKGRRQQKGKLKRNWRRAGEHAWVLEFHYEAEHAFNHQGNKGRSKIQRGVRLRFENPACVPRAAGRKIQFKIRLAPHETWQARIECVASMEGRWLTADDTIKNWNVEGLRFLESSTSARDSRPQLKDIVFRTLNRAKKDLIALRLFDLDQPDRGWVLAGGIPTYEALFGRDSIVASWECALLSAEPSRGALAELAAHSGTKENDWREEQPGRLLHEMHSNPLAALNFTPHARYYGDFSSSARYPVLVSTLWHWTGNKQAVRPFIEPALQALRWADKYANTCRDGFYRYQKRSEQGEKNQGWKDSQDAIVREDGRQVPDPLGTCEMQAFIYASKLHLSELLWWFGDIDVAKQLYREAEQLKKRFNEKFWMPKEQFLAMGIDSRGKLIRSVASDPGHCLATGSIDESLARPIANRFFRGDLFSGWGIRSLSRDHPAYNPYAYHRGTVWPMETGILVFGLTRYGFQAEANRLAKAFFEAASLFRNYRLPEVFAGHERDESHPFPGLYPNADSPQAWSAAAPFLVIQSLLGLCPYAPLGVLFVDPALPEWLPSISLSNIRVGEAVVDLHFDRNEKGETGYRVDRLQGDLRIIQQPRPWTLLANYAGQLTDIITSLVQRS